MAVLSDASQAQFFWSINISIGIQYYFETIYIKFGKCPGVFIQDRIHAILIKLWIFQLIPMMIFMFHSPEILNVYVVFCLKKKKTWLEGSKCTYNLHDMVWHDMTTNDINMLTYKGTWNSLCMKNKKWSSCILVFW